EQPIFPKNLEGMSFLRKKLPVDMQLTSGEYGYTLSDFFNILKSKSVDVLQADATRCEGITGFIEVATLAHAFNIPLSSHTAPSIHLAVCCCLKPVIHME